MNPNDGFKWVCCLTAENPVKDSLGCTAIVQIMYVRGMSLDRQMFHTYSKISLSHTFVSVEALYSIKYFKIDDSLIMAELNQILDLDLGNLIFTIKVNSRTATLKYDMVL